MKRTIEKCEASADSDSGSPVKKSKLVQNLQNFKLEPKTKFECPFPYFRQPKEIGSFSLDGNRVLKHDSSSMRYLCLPKTKDVSFQIWQGLDSFISRDENIKEYIDHLLMWISANKKSFEVKSELDNSTASDICGYG